MICLQKTHLQAALMTVRCVGFALTRKAVRLQHGHNQALHAFGLCCFCIHTASMATQPRLVAALLPTWLTNTATVAVDCYCPTLRCFGAQDEGVEPPIDRRDTWGSESDSPDNASDQSPESEDPDDGT